MYYWHYTFRIKEESQGLNFTDTAVATSTLPYFPMAAVDTYFHEEFGDYAKLEILNVIEISKKDFDVLAERLDVVGDDGDTNL